MKSNPEKIVIDYLTSAQALPVYAEVPNFEPQQINPEKYVVVESTGGSFDGLSRISKVDLAIQVYATTREQASNAALNIHEKLQKIDFDTKQVFHKSVGVPYNFTDDKPRYQITLNLKIKDD